MFPEFSPYWKYLIKNLEVKAKPGIENNTAIRDIINLDLYINIDLKIIFIDFVMYSKFESKSLESLVSFV